MGPVQVSIPFAASMWEADASGSPLTSGSPKKKTRRLPPRGIGAARLARWCLGLDSVDVWVFSSSLSHYLLETDLSYLFVCCGNGFVQLVNQGGRDGRGQL